jgi:hypothetical protein
LLDGARGSYSETARAIKVYEQTWEEPNAVPFEARLEAPEAI